MKDLEKLRDSLRQVSNCIDRLEQESFKASKYNKDYLLLIEDAERRSKILRNINQLIKIL